MQNNKAYKLALKINKLHKPLLFEIKKQINVSLEREDSCSQFRHAIKEIVDRLLKNNYKNRFQVSVQGSHKKQLKP
ncbi:hypothetical protein HY745_13345 [Candidatus Desantisbacteria bacterium]|nr:hypothetical protein [Candidatus Desantisbacteria bacterium]